MPHAYEYHEHEQISARKGNWSRAVVKRNALFFDREHQSLFRAQLFTLRLHEGPKLNIMEKIK